MSESTDTPLLRLRDVEASFPIRSSILRRTVGATMAVDGVSFDVERGSTMGLVGESGSGKSTLARAIVGLTKVTGGSIEYQGNDLTQLGPRELQPYRRDIQMIFQDPYASLNPRLTVEQLIAEGWRIHRGIVPRDQWTDEVRQLLARVGLEPDHASRYPHQFSGGQRQRIGIARALALRPKLVICDEAVSALDVSVQAQVLNLLDDLQEEFGLTYLFIAHDLSVVRHISDQVLVMNKGKIVEAAPTDQLFANPTHEYTRTLLAAIPSVRPWRERV